MHWIAAIAGTAVLAAIAPAVVAGELTALDLLRQELGAKAPAGWQLHVSRREDAIVAFITPPYQQAFDLWYEPDKLRAAMQSFCPAKDSPVWREMRSGETLMVVPTVGGKTADTMRITCTPESS
ncbi:MAG: hypothetical protein JO047_16435 [Alphaproteobacteria bacterium]|nr:hypothetical protein [Alphaproteobacteria bacterium]